jgi:hypothetical protein
MFIHSMCSARHSHCKRTRTIHKKWGQTSPLINSDLVYYHPLLPLNMPHNNKHLSFFNNMHQLDTLHIHFHFINTFAASYLNTQG